MTDPEIVYRRINSGDLGAVRGDVEQLRSIERNLDRAGDDVYAATGVPVWTGDGSTAFQARAAGLLRGVRVNYAVVARTGSGLDTAADAYRAATDRADYVIGFWRNRPSLPPAVEEILARLVNEQLIEVATSYGRQLDAIATVLTGGSDVDVDELDEETRAWVEQGMDKTEDWLTDHASSLGPLIPHTSATGDDDGRIPQGLAYDPTSGLLLQSYYDDTDADPATLSLIDRSSGAELNDLKLGGFTSPDGTSAPAPGHAGGVAVDGDEVYVTSENRIYTYSLDALQNAPRGEEVPQLKAPLEDVKGTSYSTVSNGQLFVGDFDANKLYVYDKTPDGGWERATDGGTPIEIDTPDQVQGLVVRDGEFVFSTSEGRLNQSQLVVQDRVTGDRSDPYTLPNMSEGVIEADGDLLTTYESGAAAYAHSDAKLGWLWGVKDDGSLWPSTHMTSTPLDELGLTGDFEAEPGSLRQASGELAGPAESLRGSASSLHGVQVSPSVFGEVPAAGRLSSAVNEVLGGSADSLRTGASAVDRLAEALAVAGHHYDATDSHTRELLDRLTPW